MYKIEKLAGRERYSLIYKTRFRNVVNKNEQIGAEKNLLDLSDLPICNLSTNAGFNKRMKDVFC